jgi:hypothetical protein
MAFGFETYRADGSTIQTGLTKGLVYIETLSITGSTSGSKTYTQVSGDSIVAYALQAPSDYNRVTLTPSQNGSGQGVLSWTTVTGNAGTVSKVLVFAKKLVVTDTYGAVFTNDFGENIVDLNYAVPQYAGSVQPASSPYLSQAAGTGRRLHYHRAGPFNFRPGTTRFIAMALPDVGAADIWYACASYIPAGATGDQYVDVLVSSATGASYVVPKLHVFSVDGTSSNGGTYGMQLFTATGSLIYDSSAENVTIVDSTTVSYSIGSETTFPLTFPSQAGVVAPLYSRGVVSTIDGVDRPFYYVGMVKRNGSVLHVTMKGVSSGLSIPTGEYGSNSGYCSIINLANIGGVGSASTTDPATLVSPEITSQPSSTGTLFEGNTASFSVGATGNPALSYQWRKNGSNVSGATAATYAFTVGASDYTNDAYRCYVSNSQGNALSTNAFITVSHPTTYPSYNPIPYQAIEEFDGSPQYTIYGAAGAWHNGSGDATLYDVMAESAGGAGMTAGSAAINVWLAFGTSYTWSIRQPTNGASGIGISRTLTIKVRIRSSGVVVSTGTIDLESTNS